jgi:probable addiction module antidote protein
MPKRTTDFREDLLTDLADPLEASCYLNAALEDSEQMALVALRDIAEARHMARVAEEAGVAREALYRMLRNTGNPTYSSFMGILKAVGLRIVFEPSGPKDDSANASVNSRRALGTAVAANISSLASANEAILQQPPAGGSMNGKLGCVPRKPAANEQVSHVGAALAGGRLSSRIALNP